MWFKAHPTHKTLLNIAMMYIVLAPIPVAEHLVDSSNIVLHKK